MKKEEFIKVIIKKVGEEPKVEIIKNDYYTIKGLVGGYIQYCHSDIIAEGLILVINEADKLMNLPFDFKIEDCLLKDVYL